MIVEIVTTGSELLLGQIVNTNVTYMSRRLNELGFDVLYQSTVGDNRRRMQEVLEHALSRADIVITSGGLGPTLGDITKEVSAAIFNRRMVIDEASKQLMEQRFAKQGKLSYTPNNLRQVTVPEGATIFLNHNGIASGVVLESEGKILVNLPGPPSEMKDMFERSLKPYLEAKYGYSQVIVSKVLNTCGIGESWLETELRDLFLTQSNPTIALLIRPEGVLIRLTAKADTTEAAQKLIAPWETTIRERVGKYIYAEDNVPIELVVKDLLIHHRAHVACAESCTGGLLAGRLTSVAGSSEYLQGSIVSYSNEVKAKFLQVSKDILATEGAVSEPVARQMAEGVKSLFAADYGIGITGIAGPTGGTAEKPVGLVYIGLATPKGVSVEKFIFSGNREQVRYRTTQQALTMLRQALLDEA